MWLECIIFHWPAFKVKPVQVYYIIWNVVDNYIDSVTSLQWLQAYFLFRWLFIIFWLLIFFNGVSFILSFFLNWQLWVFILWFLLYVWRSFNFVVWLLFFTLLSCLYCNCLTCVSFSGYKDIFAVYQESLRSLIPNLGHCIPDLPILWLECLCVLLTCINRSINESKVLLSLPK